jgi:hypothetical protein
MGSQNSKEVRNLNNYAYKKGFLRVNRWGVGLIICLGDRTPYVVSRIEPAVNPEALSLSIISEDDEPEFIFTNLFEKDLLPLDKNGQQILTEPNSAGKYAYDIYLIPAPILKFGSSNRMEIVDKIVNTVNGGHADSSEEEGEVLNKKPKHTTGKSNTIPNDNNILEISPTVNFTQPTKLGSYDLEDNIADYDEKIYGIM